VHDLPRQLSSEELAELFGEKTHVVDLLADSEDPLGRARKVLAELSDEHKVEALNAHPRIGDRDLPERSALEQGSDEDPALLAALARLNKLYEEKFGFRFVVFVDRRPRAEILSVLRERLQRARADELDAGLDELVAIALDRWRNR
jgi:2-oxo-4-hydroxy-4-carboxy-5-ureidoimidazoline decarboxylase